MIDGEAVLLGVDGRSDFNGLHSRRHDAEVQFYAFDMLAGDGDDMRKLPLSMRKTNLARLLRGRAEGIFVAGPKRCRSKAVAALVSERRTKRRGERGDVLASCPAEEMLCDQRGPAYLEFWRGSRGVFSLFLTTGSRVRVAHRTIVFRRCSNAVAA